LAGAAAGRAQIRYAEYYRCLPDYLTALAGQADAQRSTALGTLTTPAAIRARQSWVRTAFWKLVGGEPSRTPLNLRTTASIQRPGYRMDKVVYESQPGLIIPANLYVPSGRRGPFPGVLFQAGHSLDGKAAAPYQKCCQALARLGYVVLAPDPMGQGERTYYPKSGAGERRTRLDSADEEHSRPGRLMLLLGDSATRMQTWDAVRSLDVLASHPDVDPRRLASTGQSGGGTLTMFLAAVDGRLACAAVSCGNSENFACEGFLAPGSTDDAEQNFIGAGPLGFDRWDTLYPLAPKPLWIAASARDSFGTYSPRYLDSGRAEFARLSAVYQRLNAPAGSLEWYETPVPHALSHDLRMGIYRFFDRWLLGGTGQITSEPEVAPEPEEVVQVGRTGNAIRDFRSVTPLQLLPKPTTSGGDWKDLLHLDAPAKPPEVKVLGRADGEGCFIEGVEVSGQAGPIPVWRFIPKQSNTQPGRVLLILEPRGRNGRWREDDLYHQLASQSGWTVCAFDVRGIGDLSPELGRGNPYYARPHADEEAWAWASLILGRPLLGQRVADILSVAASLRGRDRTVLAATGHTTVPATLATALDPKIDLLYTTGGLESWAALLNLPDYTEPLANFLPGILRRTDLPAVRTSLGVRLRRGKTWDLAALSAL